MRTRLGRFEIKAEIGQGAFGKVYLALDPGMNRRVAIKELTATDDANSFNRFKNEAHTAGNLHHENIVTVYEFGQEGNTPFIVMEFVDGNDLQKTMRNNVPLSLYQKIRIMDQVAAGLHSAHRRGVVHRDIKPANIMMANDGVVKVMDFGIARLTRDATNLTQEGYLIGTVAYMAPELLAQTGAEADQLCDIWSYGVMMYELLEGKNPFHSGNIPSQIARILVNRELPQLSPGLGPPELQAVIDKLLCRPREVRYQNLEDVRFDLQPILRSLEKSEVARLLSVAQQHLIRQEWEKAEAAAREVLRIDSQNGTARIVRDKAQAEALRQSIWPRIEELIRRSNELAEQRKYAEAMDRLEEARKLDPSNEAVRGRMQELRALQQRVEDAVRLTSDAGKEFRDRHLTTAFEMVNRAKTLDPNNQNANQLFESIQNEMRARETDRVVEAAVHRTRGLMAISDLDGALQMIRTADAKYPGRSEIRDLIARLERAIDERNRKRDLASRIEQAKASVRNERYEDSVAQLVALLQLYPDEPEATDLLLHSRQELQARQRAADVQRTTDAASKLVTAQRFPDAIAMLEAGLSQYPEEPTLLRELRSTQGKFQQFQRGIALQAGLTDVEALRQKGQFQEALDRIARLHSEYPGRRDEFLDLENKVRQEKSQAERDAAVRTAFENAQRLLRANKPDLAIGVLEAAIRKIGDESDLSPLLEEARKAQSAQREREYVESALEQAENYEQAGDRALSLQIIGDALRLYPQSARMLEAQARLRKAEAAHKAEDDARRAQKVSSEVAAVEELIKTRRFDLARLKLDESTQVFPDEIFRKILNELPDRENEYVAQMVRETRERLDSQGIEAAEQWMQDYLVPYKEVAEVRKLAEDVSAAKKRRQKDRDAAARKTKAIADCLNATRDREQQRDLHGALELLDQGLKLYPQAPELTAAREHISGLIAEREDKRQRFTSIEQALSRSDWETALRLVDEAAAYRNDPDLITLRDTGLSQRKSFFDRGAAAIRAKLAENNLDDARALFNQTLERFKDQSVPGAVNEELTAAEARRTFISDNLKLAERQTDPRRAAEALQNALNRYRNDPALAAALKRVQDSITQSDHERALAARLAPIRKDVDKGNWAEALRKIGEARVDFPANPPDLVSLEKQALDLRDKACQKLVLKARESLRSGNLADVEKMLGDVLKPFAGDQPVKDLAEAHSKAKARDGLIQSARNHINARRFDEAEKCIRDLAAGFSGDSEIGRLQTALSDARDAARQQENLERGRVEGDRLMREGLYAEALGRFDLLLRQFPGDRQLERSRDAAAKAATKAAARVAPKPAPKPVTPPVPPPEVKTERRPDAGERVADGEPKKPFPKWIYAVGALVLVALAAIGFWLWRPPTPTEGIKPDRLVMTFHTRASTQDQDHFHVTGPPNIPIPAVNPPVDWVKVDRGQSPTEFVVTVRPNAATPADTFTNLVFSPDAKVRVELKVPQRGPDVDTGIHLDKDSLIFAYSTGPIPAQTVEAASQGPIPDPKPSRNWVTFKRRDVGQKDAGQAKADFDVRVSANGLPTGLNTAELTFPPDKKVRIALTVPDKKDPNKPEKPTEVQPQYLAFPEGGPRQVITVTGPIEGAVQMESWMRLMPISRNSGRAQFSVETVPGDLPPGKHSGYLTFPPNARVRVDLTVPKPSGPGPSTVTPDVQPADLPLHYTSGSPAPTGVITVTNATTLPTPQSTAPWLKVTPLNTAGKMQFQVEILPDRINREGMAYFTNRYHDDIMLFNKKVRVDLTYTDKQTRTAPPSVDISWSGSLNPGEQVEIKGLRATKGSPDLPLPTYKGTVTVQPATVEVLASPSEENNYKLTVRNNSGGVINSFSIHWVK